MRRLPYDSRPVEVTRDRGRVLAVALALGAAGACGDTSKSPAPRPTTPPRLELVAPQPPITDLAAVVRSALDAARRDDRQLLVYVGASWCEPCIQFHAAAAAGELDATFGTLRLLELDTDRDGDALTAAGYTYEQIPLFAVPGADGRASGRQIQGAIKGRDAVEQIAPRLRALLAGDPAVR